MEREDLLKQARAFVDENWEAIVADIETLVRIPSFQELDKASESAPYGPGPRASLSAALQLAQREGLRACDMEGRIGYADLPGASEKILAIIGHTDVVPAGPGWTMEPFAVTRREGYLLGRGTVDDKGPLVTALWAVKFWKDSGKELPYTIRLIFGADEETGMTDVAYYLDHCGQPAFLFTPDADFPVCYGEKGTLVGEFVSPLLAPSSCGASIESFDGGTAHNAVAGEATAVLHLPGGLEGVLRAASNVEKMSLGNDRVKLFAHGKSAHASTPEKGVSAIGILVNYLLDCGLFDGSTLEFLRLQQRLMRSWKGEDLRLDTSDADFGPLTVVGGTVEMREGRLVQGLDTRFPTTLTGKKLQEILTQRAAEAGASFAIDFCNEPFLLSRDAPCVQALLSAYNGITGENAEPFTMGGGTYARHFANATSFGPVRLDAVDPEWVGSMHGPDEGVAEEVLKDACAIYIVAIHELMQLEF